MAGIKPFGGSAKVFIDRVSDQGGKVLDLDIVIEMPNVTLKRFRGTTLLNVKEDHLEPIRNRLGIISNMHRKNFKESASPSCNEEAALRAVVQDKETMANYGSGEVWDDKKVLNVLALDTYRPSAGAANALLDPEMRPVSYLDEATVWTGLAVYHNEDHKLIGRAANGGSSEAERSESGLVIHKDYWNQGLGHETRIALAVHAFVGTLLGFKLHSNKGKHDVKMFSATLPLSEKTNEIIKQLDLEVLEKSYFPYGDNKQERTLLGISTKNLYKQLDKVILEKGINRQVTLNGLTVHEFLISI